MQDEAELNNPLSDVLDLLMLSPSEPAQLSPRDIKSQTKKILGYGSSSSARVNVVNYFKRQRDDDESMVKSFVDSSKAEFEGSSLSQSEPSEELTTSLRPYQKQALNWMIQRESGGAAHNVLHPCWESYSVKGPNNTFLKFYHNGFTGEFSTSFPSAAGRKILPDRLVY